MIGLTILILGQEASPSLWQDTPKVIEKTTENSERLGRQARTRIKPSTSRLPVQAHMCFATDGACCSLVEYYKNNGIVHKFFEKWDYYQDLYMIKSLYCNMACFLHPKVSRKQRKSPAWNSVLSNFTSI